MRLMLLSDIQGSALAGMEAYVLSDFQRGLLDSAVVKVAKIAMRGRAVSRDWDGKVVDSLTNREILRHWRVGRTPSHDRNGGL